MQDYIISCESTTDMPYGYFEKREIPVIFYKYTIGENEYEDNMERDKAQQKFFYDSLDSGLLPHTSQINEYRYFEYFEGLLKTNQQILHIAFGSGMTPSVLNAQRVAKNLNEREGKERIIVIDSLCSSSGYGMLVSIANDMKQKNEDIKTVADYIQKIRNKIHHQFYSSDMKFFKRSGRVSGVTATIATVLGICPIMRLNCDGKIIAYDKERGKANAIKRTINEMLKHCENGKNYDNKCFISHSACLEDAKLLKSQIEKIFPKLKGKIEIYTIGNIVTSHCGKGTVAIYFIGDERK